VRRFVNITRAIRIRVSDKPRKSLAAISHERLPTAAESQNSVIVAAYLLTIGSNMSIVCSLIKGVSITSVKNVTYENKIARNMQLKRYQLSKRLRLLTFLYT
jgi:hypothetical protein